MSPTLNTATDHPVAEISTAVTQPALVSKGQPYPDPEGFELREEIGKGGMGVVFRALDRAMDRDVAVKILQDRYAPDSKTAARFVEEARITGQLQHPGIPAVYQVSKLSDGRPFLAMKLIKGDTLDALLKSNAPINRLAVFEAICQALGYAHAHNVIHRDLKPSNIMVGAFGEVQVMDWGLAKVLPVSRETKSSGNPDPERITATTEIRTQRGSDGSSTQDGSILGTPAYMPPEQAAGEIDKIDLRSDVFGLGAVLCVLLTGHPPYSGQDFMSVQLKAVRGQTAEALARLDKCNAEPGVVSLCKQCLSFNFVDRPANANAVAKIIGDMRREAEDRARNAELDRVKAEVSAAEQHKRRRVWLGLATALLAGVVASSGLALWANHARDQADKARHRETTALQKETAARETAEQAQRDEARAKQEAIDERNEKDKQQKNAVEQREVANGVKKYVLEDLFELANPKIQQREQSDGLVKMDPDLKVRDLVIRASKKLDHQFADQPLVEAEIRWTLGYTLQAMGRVDLAVHHYERIRQIFTQKHGPEHPDTLSSMHNLAWTYHDLGRHSEALKLRKETFVLQKRILGPEDPHTLSSKNNLATSYTVFGRHIEALELHEQILDVRKRTLGADHPLTQSSMMGIANCYIVLGRYADAFKLHEEILNSRTQKLGIDHPDTLASMNNLAICYSNSREVEKAFKLHTQTLALRKQKLGVDHPDTLQSMSNLASSYAEVGQHSEALKLREDTLALRRQKFGDDHPDTLAVMQNLALSYSTAGRKADALKLMEDALVLSKQKLGSEHPDTLSCMQALSNTYAAVGRNAEALKLREETLTLRKRILGLDHFDTLTSMHNLAFSYVSLGRQTDALKLRVEILDMAKKKFGPDHHITLYSMHQLTFSYIDLGKRDETLKLFEETLVLQKQKLGPDHPETLVTMWGLIASLNDAKRYDDALTLIREVLTLVAQAELVGKRPKPDPILVPTMIASLSKIAIKKRDPALSREVAERWENLKRTDAISLYDAACYRAFTASVLKDKPEAKIEADKAMNWLKKSIATGFNKNRAYIEQDTDLDALRDRSDFKELLESLPKK